jgi:hypothetical protein
MGLINCPECNREISDRVVACPHCGYPLVEETEKKPEIQQVEISSVNIKDKNPAKTKRIIIALVSVLLVGVIGFLVFNYFDTKSKNEAFNIYIDKLNTTYDAMINGASTAEELLNLTGMVWANTIYKERDPSTNIYTLDKNGKFYDDFNDSLYILFNGIVGKSKISIIRASQANVESYMRELKDPPEGLEDCYKTITDMYAAFRSVTDFAINPSGSLNTFSSSKTTKIDNLVTIAQKLKTQIPDYK